MRAVRLYAAAFAVTLAACSQPVSDAQTSIESVESTSSTTTTSSPTATVPPTTASPTTTEPVLSALGNPLLGATVPAVTMLYFNSTDPDWTLKRFQTDFEPLLGQYPFVIVGDGDLAERSRAVVTVAPTGVLDETGGISSATMGAVIEPVEIAGVASVGRTSSANDISTAELQWPSPDGYQISMVAVGLDLDEAADLASYVTVDGTTPSIDPPSGYDLLYPTEPQAISVSALFVNADLGVDVTCANDGEFGFVNRQMGALARTVARPVAGTTLVQRADPAFGPEQSALDGTQWLIGDWWCTVWSTPPDPNGGEVPVIADNEMEQLLASLVIVDEATLRADAGAGELLLDPGEPWPTLTATLGAFSSGEAGAFGAGPCAVFSPDGSRIVVVGTDFESRGGSIVQFIDATTGALLRALPMSSGGCSKLPISPDGNLIFDGASLRDTRTGRVAIRLDGSGAGRGGADFSPDGRLIVIGGGRNKRAVVYSTSSGKEQADITTDDYVLMSPEFLPDGRRVLLPGLMPSARIWDLVTDREVLKFAVNDGLTSLSPDGKFVAVSDDRPRLVDTTSGETVLELSGFPDAFSPNGALLATSPQIPGDQCTIWNLTTLAKLSELPCPTSRSYVAQVSFKMDGSRIVIARDGVGEVRDTATGELISTLRLDDAQILSAAYSPDGTRIVTANNNGTVRVWEDP